MLSKYLTENTKLSRITSLKKAGDPVYSTLSEARREEIIRAGEKYLQYDYPALPATLYLDLYRTGNRTHYETPYFARRQALSALTAAECIEHEGRFLDDILNGLWCIMEESSWTIPAHNTYARDTAQYPLPRTDRPILDLFACETGAILASVHALLSEDLSGIDEEIPKRIERELNFRIVEPYLTNFYWFMGNGVERTNNWTVWCTQNVLYSIFLMPHDEETYRKACNQAVRSVDCFIDEYGFDGCCPEGASYYHHAALCLYTCLDLLNQITDGAFLPVYEEKKIKNIANYIMKVHVGGEYFLNYADCDLKPGLAGVKEYLFAKATKQEDMMRFASDQYNLKRQLYGTALSGRDVFDLLTEAFSEEETLSYAGSHPAESTERKGFKKFAAFPSVGIHAVEGESLYLSVKSGNNTGSHKHNDAGSFIVYAKGEPMLIDPGVGSYTRETFSEKRYTIWTMQSGYHNLPTIEGFEECGDLHDLPDKYYAQEVDLKRKELFDSEAYLHSLELKNAYDEKAPIETYIREIRFISDGPIEITEHLRLKDDAFPHWTLNFMSEKEPRYEKETNTLYIGGLGKIIFDRPILGISSEWIDTSDQRLQRSWKNGIYRTKVEPLGGVLRYMILAL